MKLSSAEGAKLLKKLKSEFDTLKSKESISSTFLASVGENPESVRPRYDYKEVKAGNDVKMGLGFPERLLEAMEKGALTREEMEICAKRILRLILKID